LEDITLDFDETSGSFTSTSIGVSSCFLVFVLCLRLSLLLVEIVGESMELVDGFSTGTVSVLNSACLFRRNPLRVDIVDEFASPELRFRLNLLLVELVEASLDSWFRLRPLLVEATDEFLEA
jgi:hypothetical protein